MNKSPNIAIIGAGFNGILLSCQLVLQADKPFHLTLIEKDPYFAKGIAYRTKSPVHFLNVKAANMSAFPHDPSHFLHWLQTHKHLWQPLHPSFSHLEITKDAYLPRMIYGQYLQWLWDEMLKSNTLVHIDVIQKEVSTIQKDSLTFSDNSSISADAIVLACGVPDNKSFAIQHDYFTQNIWNPHPSSILLKENLQFLPNETHIAIIGSGLTMLDALATLEEKHYGGAISVISNDGKLPEVHAELKPNPPQFIHGIPKTALELLNAIHSGIHEAVKQGYDWRYVIDELRPNTQKIWQSFAKDQKETLLPLLPIWNRHRHRMPSHYERLLERTKQNNFFVHFAGSIQKIVPSENGIRLFLKDRTIEADYVFNCSGPEMRLEKNRSPLFQHLLAADMMQPDEVDLGARVDENDSLIGKAQGSLFALGQLLFGTKIEITAVPELRENCRKMAEHLCAKFQLKG